MSNSLANTSNLVAIKTIATFGNLITIYNPATSEVEFLASELATLLNYSTTQKLTDMLDVDEFKVTPQGTLKKIKDLETHLGHEVSPRGMTIVNESGMFHAIIKSGKPEAIEMRRIITSEILPSIRKTGSYSVHQSDDKPITITESRLRDLLEEVVTRTRVTVQFKRHGPIVPYSGYDVETLVDMANEKYNLKANRTDGYDLLVLCNLVYSDNRYMPTKHGIESNILNIAANAFVYADGSTGTTKKVVINQDYADLFIDGLKQHIETKNRIKLTSTSSHVDISRLN